MREMRGGVVAALLPPITCCHEGVQIGGVGYYDHLLSEMPGLLTPLLSLQPRSFGGVGIGFPLR